ncbi:hypothetical protein, partial [Actinotalea ferrariae]|uniref:hypothetical protein n=1 Tax=Actinotalea ferrariae TaxID=1386098 RepID=UPI001C8B6436
MSTLVLLMTNSTPLSHASRDHIAPGRSHLGSPIRRAARPGLGALLRRAARPGRRAALGRAASAGHGAPLG